MKKVILITLLWLISTIFVIIWTFDNPDIIEKVKSNFKKKIKPSYHLNTEVQKDAEIIKIQTNSFTVKIKKIASLKDKTAFLLNNSNDKNFKKEQINIYTQSGYLIDNLGVKKLNLPKTFTLENNGGIKTVFFNNKQQYALISASKNDCYYASIINLADAKSLFSAKCLPEDIEKIDFNGLGSSFIKFDNKIILSLGTPTTSSAEISELAQQDNSYYGKMLVLKKENIINESLSPEIFSKGHRVPQGLTKIKKNFFSVEHGPKGGDELNKLKQGKNYGWPTVSYGTRYSYDEDGKSYSINHEKNNFEEPLFALVPSVGISALNNCPKKLYDYYKKNCLIALSLHGNPQREGKSILIYLLDEKFEKVHSVEKVYLGNNLAMRHFMTNENNELYEDIDGNIYVSVDNKGIFKVGFENFRI
jgi:glucose/arabinose dehydrogenase